MVLTTTNEPDFLMHTQQTGFQVVEALALQNTRTNLLLLAGAPDSCITVLCKSDDMICPAKNLLDLAQILWFGRCRLEFHIHCESHNTVIALRDCQPDLMRFVEREKLTLNVPYPHTSPI